VFRVCDPADLHAQHLEVWRDASKRVVHSYRAWCAAPREERHHMHVAFLDALRREEQAARQVERDATRSGRPDQLTASS
jgi:hypothetical protein